MFAANKRSGRPVWAASAVRLRSRSRENLTQYSAAPTWGCQASRSLVWRSKAEKGGKEDCPKESSITKAWNTPNWLGPGQDYWVGNQSDWFEREGSKLVQGKEVWGGCRQVLGRHWNHKIALTLSTERPQLKTETHLNLHEQVSLLSLPKQKCTSGAGCHFCALALGSQECEGALSEESGLQDGAAVEWCLARPWFAAPDWTHRTSKNWLSRVLYQVHRREEEACFCKVRGEPGSYAAPVYAGGSNE